MANTVDCIQVCKDTIILKYFKTVINTKEVSDYSETSFVVGAEGVEPPTLCL